MKLLIEDAIRELKAQFGETRVSATDPGDGGARVVVDAVELGPPYAQAETWVAFTMTPLYPYADVYPHFVRPDLSRLDGKPLEPPIHIANNFHGQPAVMVSRRTRATGPANPNSALLKLLKVQSWLLSQ